MKHAKLKPCPVCGGEAHVAREDEYWWRGECTMCGVRTAPCSDPGFAADVWNCHSDNYGRGDAK